MIYIDAQRVRAALERDGINITPNARGRSTCGRATSTSFARFHLNGPKTLALAMPVHTPGSGSDGATVSPSTANRCNCRLESPLLSQAPGGGQAELTVRC
jgi:hypothetical protein